MNISEFQSSINQRGVLQNNRFLAYFNLPRSLEQNATRYGARDKIIQARCEAAQLPGFNLTMVDQPRIGYGPLESMPHNLTMTDISLTFLLDSQSALHALFYEWFNTIVNFQGSRGQSYLGEEMRYGTTSIGAAYEVGYKEEYKTDLIISVYNASAGGSSNVGDEVMRLVAFNAFPKEVPSVDLAWGNTDDLIRLTIPFTYTDFQMYYPKAGTTFGSKPLGFDRPLAELTAEEANARIRETSEASSRNTPFN